MRTFLRVLLPVALVALGLSLPTQSAMAADTGLSAPQTGKIVSDEPGRNAPNILDGTVYSITKVGNTIIVGGSFSQVENYNTSTVITRNNVFAFDATTGKVSTTFDPNPSGTVYKVQAAADGSSVYVAGAFQSVGGASRTSRLFKADVATGALDSTFSPSKFDGDIRDLEVVGNHLFVSGKFTHIGGTAQKALGTVNATTGAYDPFFTSVLSGLHNPGLSGSVTDVLQIATNPQNTQLMAVGNFTTVDGTQSRSQIAKWDISGASAVLSPWATTQYTQACSAKFDTYMTDVEYSPDGSYFIVSTTGAYGGSNSNLGTAGCDGVFRFESSSNSPTATNTWSAYTGGDTTWTVEVTDNVIYTGGHMRWQNNPTAGDKAGQGAVARTGIAALNPVNGMPYSWNPTRARGVGIQDMLATSDGLYVGSDTTSFGHTAGNTYHARLAFVPLAGGQTLPKLQTNTLPADVYTVAAGGSQLQKRSFDGTTAGTATNVATGPGWSTATGAFMANGVLYKVNSDGTVTKMTFDGTNYGTSSAVATADAIVAQTDWHTDAKTLTSLFYANGRIYYTKSGTNALYRRGFEVEDDVVGQQRFSTTTTGFNWANVRGAFVANGKLYFGQTDGKLYSANWDQSAGAPTGTPTVVGTTTGWNTRAMFPFQGVPSAPNQPPVASASVTCAQLTCSFSSSGSSDPEGGPLTYDWDFGDGTAHSSAANPTHPYASTGDYTVTLTVTDNKGASASTTRTASANSATDTISYIGASNSVGNRTSHTVTVPTSAKTGDTLLLFFSAASNTATYSTPSGWTQVLTQNSANALGRLYTKTATASDPGSTVTVSSGTATVKDDMTLAVYRGLGTPAINASAATSQDSSSKTHQTPVVNAADGTSWLVSYWTDKASVAPAWVAPSNQTKRSTGTASQADHMSSLLTDSNGRVATGPEGGLNATAPTAGEGITMSLLLSNGTPPPANNKPTAIASQTGCTDRTCTFDGGSSTDPDGDTLTYLWDFGDGTQSTAVMPSHTFASSGNKTVTLTVNDGKGGTDSTTVTATPTDPPANNAPTAAITQASCTANSLQCSVNGSTSSDPDAGDTLTYDWDWGDNSPHSTGASPSHTYGSTKAGGYTVTLVVKDNHGASSSPATTTLTPDGTTASPTNVTFVGATSTNANATTRTTAMPSGVAVGDRLVAFFTSASTSLTYTGPSGWTLLRSDDGASSSRVWTKIATSDDAAAGAKVTVTGSGIAKSDLTVAAYHGADTAAPVINGQVDSTATADHTSPTVTAPDGRGWLVTYWADEKSTSGDTWTDPSGATRRAVSIGTGGGHVSALLSDSNGAVGAGSEGGLTSTSNAAARGLSYSLIIPSS